MARDQGPVGSYSAEQLRSPDAAVGQAVDPTAVDGHVAVDEPGDAGNSAAVGVLAKTQAWVVPAAGVAGIAVVAGHMQGDVVVGPFVGPQVPEPEVRVDGDRLVYATSGSVPVTVYS